MGVILFFCQVPEGTCGSAPIHGLTDGGERPVSRGACLRRVKTDASARRAIQGTASHGKPRLAPQLLVPGECARVCFAAWQRRNQRQCRREPGDGSCRQRIFCLVVGEASLVPWYLERSGRMPMQSCKALVFLAPQMVCCKPPQFRALLGLLRVKTGGTNGT